MATDKEIKEALETKLDRIVIIDQYLELLARKKQLQAELDRHRWIPVTERLPVNPNDDFLDIFILERNYKPYGGYLEGFRKSGSPCFRNSEMEVINNVTHWKEVILPKTQKDNNG